VQEAWLRFAQTDLDEIREPAAWLTTVVARICLDVLRSARVRREAYVGPWLPEPLVATLPATDPHALDPAGTDAVGIDPADAATRREDIGLALLVVLERLTPEQRVAFVLHDVFAVPFAEIAEILGTSPEAARQLASRARVAVSDAGLPRRRAAAAEQRRVVSAFLAAASTGDLDGLLEVLAPDAVIVGDGGGVAPAGPRPIEGALPAARFLLGVFRRALKESVVEFVPVLVNGDVGVLGEIRPLPGESLPDYLAGVGEPMRFVMAFVVSNGRIVRIYDQLNPAKLTAVPPMAELRPS
jgi:RNA polymerase sigma-70 factor (ECF subfamily)